MTSEETFRHHLNSDRRFECMEATAAALLLAVEVGESAVEQTYNTNLVAVQGMNDDQIINLAKRLNRIPE